MKKISILLILTPFFLCFTCVEHEGENCHYSIVFVNNADKTLYVNRLTDTILSKYANNPYNNLCKTLPHEVNETGLNNVSNGVFYCWESSFNDINEIPSDTLMVYIFDEEVLKNNSWGVVVENYMILQRYDLSLPDLQKLNWHVFYPPTEEMKNMKMYPKYGEN
jgi:hypothetical protein